MQNPAPGQQGQQPPYGAPPTGPSGPKTAVGLEPNLAAAVSYIWIVGLVFFIMEKENRFVRFHALQSILYGALWIVVVIALSIVNIIIALIFGVVASAAGDAGGIIGIVVWLISMLIWVLLPLAFLAMLIYAAVQAYQGKTFKIPIVGKIAENIVNK